MVSKEEPRTTVAALLGELDDAFDSAPIAGRREVIGAFVP
jgi:hypothetical protein